MNYNFATKTVKNHPLSIFNSIYAKHQIFKWVDLKLPGGNVKYNINTCYTCSICNFKSQLFQQRMQITHIFNYYRQLFSPWSVIRLHVQYFCQEYINNNSNNISLWTKTQKKPSHSQIVVKTMLVPRFCSQKTFLLLWPMYSWYCLA